MRRWPWISLVVATLVLALCGCGGGGGVPMGAPDGDAGELSLADKWRQFEDGAPTLRMTSAEVFDAWRSVARQSTHRVSLAVPLPGPVGSGSDPASPMPSDTSPTFPVDAVACSPGDCDLEPPQDGIWAVAPVLEHSGIPVAEFTSRFSRTVVTEAADSAGPEEDRRRTDAAQTDLFDTLAYGGWLDYTQFNVSHTRWCMGGEPGCADIDDAETLYTGGGVLGFMAGRYAGTTPAGMGSATWTGVMVGMEDLPAALPGSERADVFLGDARITIDDLSAPPWMCPSPTSTTSPREPGALTGAGTAFVSRTACSARFLLLRPTGSATITSPACSPAPDIRKWAASFTATVSRGPLARNVSDSTDRARKGRAVFSVPRIRPRDGWPRPGVDGTPTRHLSSQAPSLYPCPPNRAMFAVSMST